MNNIKSINISNKLNNNNIESNKLNQTEFESNKLKIRILNYLIFKIKN